MAGLRRLTVVALALVLVSFTVGQVESKRTFLNGLNQAWVNYGMDFGNNPSPSDLQTLTKTLEIVAQSGGNAVRIWVHCGAEYTPKFNSSGYVSATDNAGTLIPDMANYLSAAQRYNVSVFFVLWNAAVPMTKELVGLLTVQSKLQSYIDVVLTPMISTLKHYSSLGGIEIMNEPEGSFLVQYNSNKCLNTQFMGNWGAGWSGQNFNVQLFQKFINLQAGAIHRAGNVSVTVGSYSEVAQTNQFGYTNFYTDQCLQEAGGDPLGNLDYNQIHCYDWEGAYSPTAPFLHTASQYQTPKPLIVGEFSQAGGAGWTSQQQYSYLFQNGYAGAWGWQATGGGYNSDDLSILSKGIQAAAKLNQ